MSDLTGATRSEHSHAPPGSGDRDPPENVDELLDVELRAGDFAVGLDDEEWHFVLRCSPAAAGEFRLRGGETLAEEFGCAPEENVLVTASVSRAEELDDGVDDAEDLAAAVADGRLDERALPSSRLVLALVEFAEAKADGEWSGLREFVDPDREVNDG